MMQRVDAASPATPAESFEPALVKQRYARRTGESARYGLMNRAALLMVQERQRALADLFRYLGWRDLSAVRVLEVGCGSGTNLIELLHFGFRPEHLCGIELLEAKGKGARAALPSSLRIEIGDAVTIESPVAPASQDCVFQSTVFSSLCDDRFQHQLAARMWEWVRPGGGVLWYDFTVNNPRNPDVRGVPVRRIRSLFPDGQLRVRRVTLAPPVARAAVRLHPGFYGLLNACPLLRTHVLVWIAKAA